jgi:Ser/Thr protein kinase RdoA (MazF antagonist)
VLGELAARCHTHALGWPRPERFERLVWDTDAVFGPRATWGDWRAAPGVDAGVKPVLEAVERQICAQLDSYGRAPERFNLIHADMRLANLLVSPRGTRLIDFDDCGFGWLMYDFAAAVSFIEDDPRLPELKSAWLEGYLRHRPLEQPDIDVIDTLVMLRRMALLAWIGSHIEAPEPQALAPHFASGTAALGEAWLALRDG